MPATNESRKTTVAPVKRPSYQPCSRTRAMGPTRPTYAKRKPMAGTNLARPGTKRSRRTDLKLANKHAPTFVRQGSVRLVVRALQRVNVKRVVGAGDDVRHDPDAVSDVLTCLLGAVELVRLFVRLFDEADIASAGGCCNYADPRRALKAARVGGRMKCQAQGH